MPPLDNWRERFDKEFHYRGEGHWFHTVNVCADPDDEDKVTSTTDTAWAVPDSLKSFIESLLSSYHSRIDEVIEGMKKYIGDSDDWGTAKQKWELNNRQVYNQALSDLKEEISKLFK